MSEQNGPSMPTDLGQRFAHAIAAQDPSALAALLAPDVDFRALTPGRFWEAGDADAVVDVILGTWFPPERSISAVLAVAPDMVGTVDHIAYRFRVRRADGDFVIEQQVYLDTDDDRISRLHILCSGFVGEVQPA